MKTEYMGTKFPFRKVFIINGSGGKGKDQFVTFCFKELKNTYNEIDCVNVSTVDRAKAVATYLGWNGEKTEKDRAFLSDIKDALTKWKDIPNGEVIDKFIVTSFFSKNFIMFIHCREPEAIDDLKARIGEHGGEAETILVRRESVPSIESNHADRDVENYNYDWIIENNKGLDDLEETAICFCNYHFASLINKVFMEDYFL